MRVNNPPLIVGSAQHERCVFKNADGGREVRDRVGGEAVIARHAYRCVAGGNPGVSLLAGDDLEGRRLQWNANSHGEDYVFERGALRDTILSVWFDQPGKPNLASQLRPRREEITRRVAMRAARRPGVVVPPSIDGSLEVMLACLEAAQLAKTPSYVCVSRQMVFAPARLIAAASKIDTLQIGADAFREMMRPYTNGSIACDIANARTLGFNNVIVTRGDAGAIGCIGGEWVSSPGYRVEVVNEGVGASAFAGAYAAATYGLGLPAQRAIEVATAAASLSVAGICWEGLESLDELARERQRSKPQTVRQPKARSKPRPKSRPEPVPAQVERQRRRSIMTTSMAMAAVMLVGVWLLAS